MCRCSVRAVVISLPSAPSLGEQRALSPVAVPGSLSEAQIGLREREREREARARLAIVLTTGQGDADAFSLLLSPHLSLPLSLPPLSRLYRQQSHGPPLLLSPRPLPRLPLPPSLALSLSHTQHTPPTTVPSLSPPASPSLSLSPTPSPSLAPTPSLTNTPTLSLSPSLSLSLLFPLGRIRTRASPNELVKDSRSRAPRRDCVDVSARFSALPARESEP